MKIRIKGNSLRYRITRSEVAKLASEGRLIELTAFAGKTLEYAIVVGDGKKLSADFIGNKIVLYMPQVMVEELNDTDRVGFDDRTDTVSLLVEKDFLCIDNTDEDQSDHYPNPHLTC